MRARWPGFHVFEVTFLKISCHESGKIPAPKLSGLGMSEAVGFSSGAVLDRR